MAFRYDTYCGLYCGACPVLIGNETGKLAEIARRWGAKPGDLVCRGCKSGVESVYCKKCDLKSCAEDKRVEFCCDCDDYPCSKLTDFVDDQHAHHSVVLRNLSRIKKIGVRNWLTEQKTRWSCPECSTRFTWYDQACAQCGGRLFNSRDEEKGISTENRMGGL